MGIFESDSEKLQIILRRCAGTVGLDSPGFCFSGILHKLGEKGFFMKRHSFFPLFLLLCAVMLLEIHLYSRAGLQKLNMESIRSDWFRAQETGEEMTAYLKELKPEERGEAAGLFLLNQGSGRDWDSRASAWKSRPSWSAFEKASSAVWQDVQYFPVPRSSSKESRTVSFQDTWMAERTYGGNRGHEGTDLIASEDTPGLYPVVSMTDGTVVSKGWLEKGGWRLGILAPSGGYFYYAHLDSYGDVEEGDQVRAGEILGFMGNSGYGPEGTTGMFVTHLHLGIYLYPDGVETSVNPNWILRMVEEKKLSCSF